VYKFLILKAHYRSVLDFSEEQIQATIASLSKFYSALVLADKIIANDLALVPVPEGFQQALEKADDQIEIAMNDDFNTPVVWAQFFEILKNFNSFCNKPGKVKPEMKAIAEVFKAWILKTGKLFSLFQQPADEFLRSLEDLLLEQKKLKRDQIDKLVNQRWLAKKNKNFVESDKIRDELLALGIVVLDSPEGTTWEVQK
jgi:cysteinyl-tRNA synthetase